MSYIRRDESPGYHHVVTRGNNKRVIYIDDRDRAYFCRRVEIVAARYGWTILAFCLMSNHYHLLIKVGDRGLARGMCELNAGYAVNFNQTHGRVNHLFGKRYWNRRIKTDASFLNTVRYIVQNPRRAGGSGPLEGYAWSSYAATIGASYPRLKVDLLELLEHFGRTPARAIEEFKAFCAAIPLSGHVRWQPP